MKKIFQKIVLILLLILLIYVTYSKYIKKDKLTRIGGYGFLVVLTGSMEPEIKAGEFILIKECSEYKPQDIVTYEDNNILVTHRIIETNGKQFLAKGDANNREDDLKDTSKILGKIVFHSMKVGIFVRIYLKYVIIAIIVVIIFKNIYFVINTKNNKKEGNSLEK